MTNSPQCDDSNKRQRIAEPPDATSSEPPHVTPSQRILQETYWDSSDAKDLVGWIETDSDAKETLIRHIEQLKTVNNTNDNWRNVIMGRDPDDFCTSTDIFEIRQRSALLCCAYQNLLEHMNGWTWQACCEEACNHLNRVGIVQATYHGSVALWNIEFRMLKNFAHPNPRAQGGKRAMPLLFEKFPEAKDAIERFAVKKLATLTIEAVHDFVHT